jgi:hypothetical protein
MHVPEEIQAEAKRLTIAQDHVKEIFSFVMEKMQQDISNTLFNISVSMGVEVIPDLIWGGKNDVLCAVIKAHIEDTNIDLCKETKKSIAELKAAAESKMAYIESKDKDKNFAIAFQRPMNTELKSQEGQMYEQYVKYDHLKIDRMLDTQKAANDIYQFLIYGTDPN